MENCGTLLSMVWPAILFPMVHYFSGRAHISCCYPSLGPESHKLDVRYQIGGGFLDSTIDSMRPPANQLLSMTVAGLALARRYHCRSSLGSLAQYVVSAPPLNVARHDTLLRIPFHRVSRLLAHRPDG